MQGESCIGDWRPLARPEKTCHASVQHSESTSSRSTGETPQVRRSPRPAPILASSGAARGSRPEPVVDRDEVVMYGLRRPRPRSADRPADAWLMTKIRPDMALWARDRADEESRRLQRISV